MRTPLRSDDSASPSTPQGADLSASTSTIVHQVKEDLDSEI